MKTTALILAATLATSLAGCAITDPANEANLAEARRITPVCTAGPDCDAKWEAAQLWVVKHARFKLQTATGVVIQTYGPASSVDLSTAIAVTVTKEPAGEQRYRIVASMMCGNHYGCIPEAPAALLDFNRTVNAARP